MYIFLPTNKVLKTLCFAIFVLFAFPNKGISQVVINEVMHYPSGSQGMIAGGTEYVELFNTSPCQSVNIGCYIIGTADIDGIANNQGSIMIPSGTILPPYGHYVIGTSSSSANAASVDFQTNNNTTSYCATGQFLMANGDGWIALYNSSGQPIDALYWTVSAGESSKITTDGDLDDSPCIVTTSPTCTAVASLLSAKGIYQLNSALISYGGQYVNANTFSRIPDGGTWTRSIAPSINDLTVGNCNGGAASCLVAPTPPSLTNIVETCVNGGTQYTISFTISGGTSPYTVSGITGTLTGNNFVSNPISTSVHPVVSVSDNAGCTIATTYTGVGACAATICPTITASNMNGGVAPVTTCPGGIVNFGATLNNPIGVTGINWYIGTSNTFNPYSGQGTLIGNSPLSVSCPPTCPSLLAVFINACNGTGNEQDNEYIVFSSGNGFAVNDLNVNLPNDVGTGNMDIGVAAGCALQTPQSALITALQAGSCNPTNVFAGVPGGVIPAGAIVILFTDSNVTATYNFSDICATGKPVYILQSGCNRTAGAFVNSTVNNCTVGTAANRRSTVITLDNCTCADSIVYDRCGLTDVDGEYAFKNGQAVSTVANGGVVVNTLNPCNGPNFATLNLPSSASVTYQYSPSGTLCGGGPYYVVGVASPTPANPCPQTFTGYFQVNITCPTATITPMNPTVCSGSPITFTATGGGTYVWSTGQTTASITVSSTTNTSYTVTVTNNGCTATASTTLTIGAPTSSTNFGTYASAVYMNVNGTSSFWNTAGSGVNLINPTLPLQTYPSNNFGAFNYQSGALIYSGGEIKTSKTGAGNVCGANMYYRVYKVGSTPPAFTSTTMPFFSDCNTGTSTFNVGGGPCVAGNQKWQKNNANVNLTNNCPGNYILEVYYDISGSDSGVGCGTVIPDNNCGANYSAFFTINNYPITTTASTNAASYCPNNTVTISTTVPTQTLVTLPFTYNWSGPSGYTSNVRTPAGFAATTATAGTYTVTVSDACGMSATSSVTVTLNSTPTAVITPSGPTTVCAGGSVVLTASGGTSYLWANGSPSNTRTVTATANYCVTVTNAQGCTASACQQVTVNPALTVNAGPDGLICSGGTTLSATATGGTAPYTYVWAGLGTGQTFIVSPTTTTTYTVNLTDAAGCTATDQVVITTYPLTISPNANICQGQSTQLQVTGTNCGLLWSPAYGLSSVTSSNPTAQPLVTTTYTVTVTQCGTNLVTNSNFSAGNTGFTSGYTYGPGGAWGPISNPGTYFVTNNANTAHSNFANCTDHTTGTGNMIVGNGASVANTNVWCQTFACTPNTNYMLGTWGAIPQSGNLPNSIMQFVINGVPFTPTFTLPSTPCTWSQFTSIWNSGPATSVTFCIRTTLTSAPGNDFLLDDIFFSPICVSTRTVTVNVTPFPQPTISGTTGICNGSSTTLTATGGGTYTWSNGLGTNATTSTITTPGTYTVTVTDNGCSSTVSQAVTAFSDPVSNISPSVAVLNCTTPSINLMASGGSAYLWSTGATTAMLNVTTPGAYNVTVTTANGCTGTAQRNVTQDITTPTAAASPTTATIDCNVTSAALSASGGGTYLWTGGSTNANLTVITGGTYTVIVTGSNGCTATASSVVTQNTTPPSASISQSASSLDCNTTNLDLTAAGGSSYLWTNGSTNAILNVTTGGTYIVTVTDTNGCIATAQNVVSQDISTPSANITANLSTLTCANPNANLTATGGTSYLWTNGSTNAVLNVTAGGSYDVTVTGSNGCTAAAQFIIAQDFVAPTASVSASISTLNCTNTSSDLTATGGTSYLWGNGTTNAMLTVNTPGTYNVTVTGANGCSATAQNVISQDIAQPSAAVNPTTATLTCSTTSASLTASGGGSYTWAGGSTNATFNATAIGNYVVTVTGSNGCTATAQSIVTQNITPPTASISGSNVICTGGSTSLTASGGTSYLWTGGSTNAALNVSAIGTYIVTVTGANGCQATASQTVTQQNLTLSEQIDNETCAGDNDGAITVTPSPTGGSYTYTWSNSTLSGSSPFDLAPGNYAVTVSDGNCSATASYTIAQGLSIVADAGIDQIIQAGATATLTASPSGYNYTWTAVNGFNQTGSPIDVTPTTTTVYYLLVTDGICSDTDSTTVTVENIDLQIPNVFTPTGDNTNDLFRPVNTTSDTKFVEFKVYNRWGKLVYDGSKNNNAGWDGAFDGEKQPRDTYIYLIRIGSNSGTSEEQMFTGDVTLMR